MQNAMCYMQYVKCYVKDIMWSVQYDKYDDAYYSHAMTFLTYICKFHSLS